MNYRRISRALRIVLCLAMGVLYSSALKAGILEENYSWTEYMSPTGIFEVTIPDLYRTDIDQIRNNAFTVISAEELFASIDQRPYKPGIKNYIVRFDQTFGPSLTKEEKGRFLERDIESYVSLYAPRGGVLQSRFPRRLHEYNGAEITMTYNDPETGLQGLRAAIFYTDNSRIEQILTGPADLLTAVRSEQFFQSLDIENGITQQKGSYEDLWLYHTSPLKIFTVLLPPDDNPYVARAPRIQSAGDEEKISFIFNDPVRRQKVFYNIYGHRTEEPLTYQTAEDFLLHRHVAKYLKVPKGVIVERGQSGKVPRLETYFNVSPHKKFPFIEAVKLRAFFFKNYIMVQEIVASELLMDTEFINNAIKQIEFHPDKAHQAYMEALKTNQAEH